MSFDVCVQWFRRGEADWVATDLVLEAFGSALIAEDDFGWRLSFGQEAMSDIYLSFDGDDTSRVCAVTVNRPSTADAMWVALFGLLGIGNSVFFFPEGGLFVRSSNVREHLPIDLIEALGEPQPIVQSQDLVRAIQSS
ncbi:hypothetical protein [Gallaecimonas xiamenensis]|uniref:Uncharacterized protein n=1 Tax=Gallaecimonas xiamenensis 3-C-1 TaxID=745411 RepID=K2JR44_9GAMM|nr:hypothetical protein [Gallaecimonas xiamenensis]EKE77803.1 hypothetical protein B3C1_00045 [Gallaecimonas xiamenensis 3-C-1]